MVGIVDLRLETEWVKEKMRRVSVRVEVRFPCNIGTKV